MMKSWIGGDFLRGLTYSSRDQLRDWGYTIYAFMRWRSSVFEVFLAQYPVNISYITYLFLPSLPKSYHRLDSTHARYSHQIQYL